MGTRRLLGRVLGVFGLASFFGFAACQQVLGLDQSTLSVTAVSRICECVPLTKQGPTFAGSEAAACDQALAEQPDELLLAVADNGCTDCANVIPCYAQLTEASEPGDACGTSPECASWACCQGVLSVELVLGGGSLKPVLVSSPPEASCCASCKPCGDAFAALNSDTEVIACAESEAPLYELLVCLAGNTAGCSCGPPDGVTLECLSCLANQDDAVERCSSEFNACATDLARPVPP